MVSDMNNQTGVRTSWPLKFRNLHPRCLPQMHPKAAPEKVGGKASEDPANHGA